MDPSGVVAEKETFFFEQRRSRRPAKRYKKSPEELPHDLRFAHLNPRVAAYLANKEKEQKGGDFVDDGLGNKSLLPQINQTVSLLRQRLDSILSNASDTQRLLFEETKSGSGSLLEQLARILYLFEGLKLHFPTSLENQLLLGWKELVTEAKYSTREWQLSRSKEEFEKSMKSEQSSKTDDKEVCGSKDLTQGDTEDESKPGKETEGRRTRSKMASSRGSNFDQTEGHARGESSERSKIMDSNPSLVLPKSKDSQIQSLSTPKPKTRLEKYKTSLGFDSRPGSGRSRQSLSMTKRSMIKHDDLMSVLAESLSDGAKSLLAQPSFMQTIQFQLSSKLCDERGWIIHPDVKDDKERQTMLEWATQRLQLAIKHKKEHNELEKELGLDQPSQIKFYGDNHKEQLEKYKGKGKQRTNTALLKGQKPKIPTMLPRSEGKLMLMTTVGDGSSVVYYPSGRPAIVTSRSNINRPGFYTVVYDNTPEQKMLATFIPSGRGCCYHGNGVVNFLATDKGGTMSETNGGINKRWKWPLAGAKLPVTIVIQLNNQLTFRCCNQSQMHVFFSCHKEHAKFHVGVTTGAEESMTREDMGLLVSGMTFSSKAANDITKASKPKPSPGPQAKRSKSRGKSKSPVPASELQKLIADFPTTDTTENDVDADKELARFQRKIKNLTEDWLEHYRIAVGITSPHIKTLRDGPTRRNRHINSAKSSPAESGRVIIESMATQVPKASVSIRAPSAPAGRTVNRPPSVMSEHQSEPQPMVKFDDKPEQIELEEQISLGCTTPFPPYSETGSSITKSYRIKSAPPSHRSVAPLEGLSPSIGLCTVALRMSMLGEERPICRCSRHHIPYVSDIEFDEFIQNHAPSEQLIIVSIQSSLYPSNSHGEDMLQKLHAEKNRNRARPCMQSRSDTFRVLLYDVATAASFSDHSQPLLLRRHNVVPGMFLMYEGGKLLFCDHIFNGYGNERKDLQKQMMQTRRSATQGRILPKDFRFSPQHGRHGRRAAWGGTVGGAGVDHRGNTGVTTEKSALQGTSSSSLSSGDSADVPYSFQFSGIDSSMKFVRASLGAVGYDVLPPSTGSLTRSKTEPIQLSQKVPRISGRSKTQISQGVKV